MTPQQRLIKAVNSLLPLIQIHVTAKTDFLETEVDENKIILTVDFDAERSQACFALVTNTGHIPL
jgi:hypothetical protein